MWVSNSSGVVSSRVPRVVIPAALHRPSMRPNSSTVRVTDRLACCGSAISVCTNRTSPPSSSNSAANRLPASTRRPVTTTWAPSRTAARADAPPTPCVPPLINTTFPSSKPLMDVLFVSGGRALVDQESVPGGGDGTLPLPCGIDCATEHHDVAVIDVDGRVVARGRAATTRSGSRSWPRPVTAPGI